jgi:hypothetical protein
MNADVSEKAWTRIGGRDEWSQMAWFVKLANTDLDGLSPGDIQNWLDECHAIRMVPEGLFSDRKRYPHHRGWIGSPSPTLTDLQNIKAEIAPHLDRLANDKDTEIGPITVQHRTRFRKSNEAERNGGYPPTLIYQIAMSIDSKRSWSDDLLLRMTRLLQQFVDNIRRCPHCKKVFVQLRRNATYCGPSCYTVAGMQRLRATRRKQGGKRMRKGPIALASKKTG